MIKQLQARGAFWFALGLLVFAPALALQAWAADPQIASYTDDPDPVPAGGIVTLTSIIDNNAVTAALNVRLTVPVPAGASFVDAPAGCSLLAAAPPLPQRVECVLGTIGPLGGDVRTLPIRFRALGPGPATLVSTATITSSNDTNNANNVQNQTTSVVSGANLALAKSDSPDPVVGGSNVTYTLTVSNAGPNAAGSLQIVDDLPPSVSFVSATGTGWTCSRVNQRVTCTHPGPHGVGAPIPVVTLVGTVNASGGTVTNTASVAPGVAGGVPDPDTTDNTAVANTTVLPGADIRIDDKSVTSGTPVVAGANATFRIQPRNAGPATAVNAVVTDSLPAGWTFVSASGPNWSCGHAAGTVTCTRASFPTTATDDIALVATAPDNAAVGPVGTTYTNTATIAADSNDPNPGNNSGSVNVQVLPDGADLRLAKDKSPNPVAQGSQLTSDIHVFNNGPRRATGPLRVVEVLTGETYVSFSGTGWTCVPDGAVVVCDHPNATGLNVGDRLPILRIITTATASGAVTNTACSGGSVPAGSGAATARPPLEGDPNPGNDCVTRSSNSTVVRPDLAIAKTTTTPVGADKLVSTGEAFVEFNLRVSNVSPTAETATGVRVVDTIPGGLFIAGRTTVAVQSVTVTGATPATFNCTVAGATVTCNQSGGQFAQGDIADIVIRVNRPFNDGGPFTNTATVSNTAQGDPNPGNNSASDTVTVEPIADIEMTGKTVTPNPVRAGENATYALAFRNSGPSTAQNVSLVDTFAFPGGDSGFTVVSVASSKAGSSCSIAAGAVLAPGNASFSCTIGSLANGETQSVTLVVRPNFQAGNGVRAVSNSASVSTSTVENPAGGDNGNNSRNAALTVNAAQVDLVTNKADVFGGVVVDPVGYLPGTGAVMSYAVRVTNSGPSFATNVRISENMVPPAGKRIQFVCDTVSFNSATCNAPTLCPGASNAPSVPGSAIPPFSCSVPAGNASTGPAVGELAANQSKTIFLRFLALDQPQPTGDVYTNTATASSNEPDSQPANNVEGEQTTTRQRVDLRVTKTASKASVSLLEPFDWIVTVQNRGPGNSLQTDLTDTLPLGAEVTGPVTWTRSLQPGNGSCTVNDRTVTCALGQLDGAALPNPGQAVVTIPARFTSFPAGGTGVNTATVDTDPGKTGGIDTPGNNNVGTHPMPVVRSSLAGTVFQDRLRDGANGGTPQVAASEPRIAVVRLRLQGEDAFGNPVDRQVDTDADGNYRFDNLGPAGPAGYTITQTQPTGFVNGPVDPPVPGAGGGSYAAAAPGGGSVWSAIALPAGTDLGNYNFPEVRRPSLAGQVYVDVDGNGSRNAGDIAIPGATVILRNALTLAQVATATTGVDGRYSFANLDPLIPYLLEEPLPATPTNLSNGPVNPGLIGGAACVAGCTAQPDAPAAGTDRIAAIDLSVGTDGTEFNFGEIQLASISGLIFVDSNRDGTLGAGETGRLPGETLRLVQGADCGSGTTIATTTTQPDGSYRFDGVRAYRDYIVCQTQPLGYGTGSALGVVGSNAIAVTNLLPAGSANNNFGETLATLAGSVYQDTGAGTPANFDNGQRDAGELGIPGVRITLTGTDARGNPVNRFVDTDADGRWSFADLVAPNGQGYTVSEGAIPPGAGSFIDGRDTAGSAGGGVAVNDVISGIALPAGGDASGYLFGELPAASIAGTVYLDRDRNGQIAALPTDGRLPGVTLRLVQGADCTLGTTLATTQTDADGNYRFDNVRAGGSYRVCQTQPAGYASGSENPGVNASSPGTNVIAIANLPAAGSLLNHFGELAASLAGSVYADFSPINPANSNNGQRDAGEVGIVGVGVTLTGRDINGTPVSRTATTDATGFWRFDDLVQSDASGYTVTEGPIPPASGVFNDGRDTAGSQGGNATAVNDQISAILLPAGDVAINYLFGELPIAPISGTVYIDRDRNGQIGTPPTDGRIPGVTLRLVLGTDCNGVEVARTLTGAFGNYEFSGASAHLTYTICQVQPSGYADGGVNPGGNAGSGGANSITITDLPPAGSPGNHFGERVGSVAGSVILDADNDGSRQAGDSALPGVTVTLTGSDVNGQAVSRTTVTDASGNWRFDDLLAAGPEGYTVAEQAAQPVFAGTTTLNGRTTAGSIAGTASGAATAVSVTPSAISGIALPAGGDSLGNLFAEILPVALSGTVFIDVDNSGTQNNASDAGLAAVALVITGTDDTGAAVTRNIVTGPDGRYNVADLRPGTYTVTEPQQPAGTSNGQTLPGTAGGTATPPATLPSAIAGIALLTPGGSSSANNFAEIPNTSAISGRVWLDDDNNGRIDNGETGIPGVTIELTGTDAAGRLVNRTTTTDANGNWSFGELSPGNYNVREPAQPAGTVNGTTVPGTAGGTATAVSTVPSAIAGIALGVGQVSDDNFFGEIPVGDIAGIVYADNDNNGQVGAGEAGLPGVTLVLTGTDDLGNPVNVQVQTGPDGRYSFPGLRPGNYTVTQPAQPAGTINGITSPGSAGGSATGVGTVPSAISQIVLRPGARSSDNNFGEITESPDLRVSKRLEGVDRFTVGFVGRYTITVRNAGNASTNGVYTVRDRLPAGLTLNAVPTGTGWTCTGAANDSRFDCTASSVIAAGANAAASIVVPVNVAASAAANSPLNNLVLVEGGGEIPARAPTPAERAAFDNGDFAALPVCTAVIEHNACRVPTIVQLSAAISGTVWFDGGSSSRLLDAGDRRLPGWQVEIVNPATGEVVGRATTGADGRYRVENLLPGAPLAVRFREPGSGIVYGYPVNGETAPGSSGATCNPQAGPGGSASSCVGTGATPALTVVLAAGQELQQQSLPVDPSGVVYDSGTRAPVPGSIVTFAPVGACPGWDPSTGIVGATLGGYTVNGPAVSMTVGADGFYQYLLAPSSPASCTFGLTVTPPGGYTFQSTAIPPTAGPLVPPGGPGSVFPVQPQAGAPIAAPGTATTYYLTLNSGSAGANIIHNHIPLDPQLPTAIGLAKTGDKAVAEIGDSVRYSITVTVTAGALPRQTTVVDRLPAGFTYIPGTAMVGERSIADPQGGVGPRLAFNLGAMGPGNTLVLRYRVRIGVGAQQGDGINTAQAHACGAPAGCVDAAFNPLAGSVATNQARHRVRVSGGVFGTEACVLGKIYVDCNHNQVQDREELGIPGVRLVMQDGTTLISDSEGKYSVCGLSPRSAVLRADPSTLPRGSRLVTTSSRNLGDAGSLWLDLKTGELHRADFAEGSCSNTVLEQVKARRAQGEVRAPENEREGRPALRFDSKAHGLDTQRSPQQGTEGANQQTPKPRGPRREPAGPAQDESNKPTPTLPMNRPPPAGRDASQAPDSTTGKGGSDGR